MITLRTSTRRWEAFVEQIKQFLEADWVELLIDARRVHGYRSPDAPALWIRDHADMLRIGRYLQADVTSAVDAFLSMQSQSGRVFDFVQVNPSLIGERENWERWVRVPVEADVEFRLVNAAFQAWQSTEDQAWLRRQITRLEKALHYTLSHPLRWDEKHNLVKRPYTIDTWDFDYTAGRAPWLNFQITDHTYWGIFHGDNSGLFQACNFIAKMWQQLGHPEHADFWIETAAGIKQRANQLLFNGRFYTHFYKLTPVTIEGADEANQLSLSTPMAINRGMATHPMAVAIIKEYQRRRQTTSAFAEWFGIDPPFPDGIFGDPKLVAGAYINGGIFPLVGGELSRAAFNHGFEMYGLDILTRYRQMVERDGASYLWYFPDGRPSTVETSTSPEALPTDGWGSSAMLLAFLEGLCGIVDESTGFARVTCSPRWAVTEETEVEVFVSYEASGKGFGYKFRHDRQKRRIILETTPPPQGVALRVLLPFECSVEHVFLSNSPKAYQETTIENSGYVEMQIQGSKKKVVEIHYKQN